LGEGWHNNHHYCASSTRQGFFWWEIDVSFYALKGLSCLGLVWGLKTPPRSILAFGNSRHVADTRNTRAPGRPAALIAVEGQRESR